MNTRLKCNASLLILVATSAVLGQGSAKDYERAANLQPLTRDKVFRIRVEPNWIDASRLWYRVETSPSSREFVLVDAKMATRQPAFDHERLADGLSRATGTSISADSLPFQQITLEGNQVAFAHAGKQWTCDLGTYELTEAVHGEDVSDSLKSLTEIRPSRGRGEETYLRFINRLDESVTLFWIEGNGRRREYQTIAAGEAHEQHTFGRHVWLATTKDGKPVAVFEATNERRDAIIDGKVTIKVNQRSSDRRSHREQADRSTSPDGRWQVFIKDGNVFLREVSTNEETQLSRSGTDEDPFVGRFSWSPDSKRLVAMQEKLGEKREVHMVESSPKDQLQPKLHTIVYAKPGDKLPVARPRLFDVDTKTGIEISEGLFPNAWSISDVRWQPDSQRFSFLYNQRGHQVLRIVVVNAETGEAAALIDEQSHTFIDYAHKKYSYILDESHELIWMSERDGWNHLYLHDSRTGQERCQITQGPWVVRGVERVDAKARRIWFRASGVYPEQDPYYIHHGFVDFDGSDLTFLTSGNGTHEVEFSPTGEFFVDRYSRVDMPTVTELRRSSDGSLICELERGDGRTLLATGWRAPIRFAAKGRDGKTDIYGVIYLPTSFDENKTYPVIEKIYAGPHGSFVPKSFASFRRDQTYAELGFIVVQIDGMGTSNRSKAFHDVCWKNLGDSGFPDRILWMQAAAAAYPQMDLSRVGIFGGSAGGQSTLRALLAFGNFYKVGVADCGCHDNRMDKVWWNELWMGWPIGDHYQEQSNVTQAHRLTGKLLLTIGELDRNVDPASTMQVVSALIKADKDFDLLIVPGAGHGIGESPYANRRRQDFFVRHLWGKEPRH